ncbi:hypothetical protein [Ottowia sp. oral taxon 894]|uniref:hypothetical protein n=1 Tax=Ottowia sp. oral taxon 894 TaxID=1658672 RepID=UPI001C122D27|nr:hypothetical protein [Ottowia sp. oral taxon 894]
MFTQFAKSFTELGGVLFDDAGERNDVNHASHIVPFSVFQRERHGSEGFAAAGKDGERKQSLRLCGLIDGNDREFRYTGGLRRRCVFRLRFVAGLGRYVVRKR